MICVQRIRHVHPKDKLSLGFFQGTVVKVAMVKWGASFETGNCIVLHLGTEENC